MRGCFPPGKRLEPSSLVFPAHAGVFLVFGFFQHLTSGLPRACGGVSFSALCRVCLWRSSPRMRGCFFDLSTCIRPSWVFPAHAGVFPTTFLSNLRQPQSSPRMRGCFCTRTRTAELLEVFPAHAGVFPARRRETSSSTGLPRACGGVSMSWCLTARRARPSPRMRGCFRVLCALCERPFRLPRACGSGSTPE